MKVYKRRGHQQSKSTIPPFQQNTSLVYPEQEPKVETVGTREESGLPKRVVYRSI